MNAKDEKAAQYQDDYQRMIKKRQMDQKKKEKALKDKMNGHG